MAASSSGGGVLKDLVHPNFNETLKSHNSVSFKLVKTGAHIGLYISFEENNGDIFHLSHSVWFHRFIGSNLREARGRIAASRNNLSQKEWWTAKRGETTNIIIQHNLVEYNKTMF